MISTVTLHSILAHAEVDVVAVFTTHLIFSARSLAAGVGEVGVSLTTFSEMETGVMPSVPSEATIFGMIWKSPSMRQPMAVKRKLPSPKCANAKPARAPEPKRVLQPKPAPHAEVAAK